VYTGAAKVDPAPVIDPLADAVVDPLVPDGVDEVDEFELPHAASPTASRAAAGRATSLRDFTLAP
jgi:hypothetical protein